MKSLVNHGGDAAVSPTQNFCFVYLCLGWVGAPKTWNFASTMFATNVDTSTLLHMCSHLWDGKLRLQYYRLKVQLPIHTNICLKTREVLLIPNDKYDVGECGMATKCLKTQRVRILDITFRIVYIEKIREREHVQSLGGRRWD